MAYGLAGLGSMAGGLAQGWNQARQQTFAMRMQQAQELGRQADEAIKTWQTLPEGAVKDLAWKAHADLLDQQQKVMGDKGPGAWNTVKHVFGMLPGLGKITPGETDTPGGGQVKQSDVAMPSSVNGPPTQTPALPGYQAPGGPLAASQAGSVPDIAIPGGGGSMLPPRPSSAQAAPSASVEGTPAGSSYSVPIQRLPQEAQQATGTQPDYGQQPLSTYQRMGMNPPRLDTSWVNAIAQSAQNAHGSWNTVLSDPKAMNDVMNGMQVAARSGKMPEFLEGLKTAFPMMGTPTMRVDPSSGFGKTLGLSQPADIPMNVAVEGLRLNMPAERIKNDAAQAEMDAAQWNSQHPGQTMPQDMHDRLVTLRMALSPARDEYQAIFATSGSPQEAMGKIRTLDKQKRADQLEFDKQRFGAEEAERLKNERPDVRVSNGNYVSLNPRTLESKPFLDKNGAPVRADLRGTSTDWFPYSSGKGYSGFNESAIERDYASDPEGVKAELRRIVTSGDFKPELPRKNAFDSPQPNPAYHGVMLWLAKRGIAPADVGIEQQPKPGGIFSGTGGSAFTPPPAPTWTAPR